MKECLFSFIILIWQSFIKRWFQFFLLILCKNRFVPMVGVPSTMRGIQWRAQEFIMGGSRCKVCKEIIFTMRSSSGTKSISPESHICSLVEQHLRRVLAGSNKPNQLIFYMTHSATDHWAKGQRELIILRWELRKWRFLMSADGWPIISGKYLNFQRSEGLWNKRYAFLR